MSYINANMICPTSVDLLNSCLFSAPEVQARRLLFPSGPVNLLVINPVAPTSDLSPGCPFAFQSSVQFTPATSHLETNVIPLWEWCFFQVPLAPGKSAVAVDR